MTVITLQVGQCGNQLGQSLWKNLDRQASSLASEDSQEISQFFKFDQCGHRLARCLLIDTEPKVINGVFKQDKNSIFSRRRCYLGQSGRGNNWAFGYHQPLSSGPTSQSKQAQTAPPLSPPILVPWNSSALVEDPNQEEHHILEHVVEGIRHESEECDGAPDFLMLHSIGGGSGSGLGSHILEHIREEYPLNNVATLSVAPRAAGDSPMQSLNSVLALSFLQAYADVIPLYDNQEMMDIAEKGSAGRGRTSLEDINEVIAHSAIGALWPLQPAEAYGGQSRIRDMVSTVASDVCCKLVQARTASVNINSPSASLWQDACRAVQQQFNRFDALDGGRPITTSGALLLSRGFPDANPSSEGAAGMTFVRSAGGQQAFVGQQLTDCSDLITMHSGPCTLNCGTAASSSSVKKQQDAASLTCVANRSSMIGLLDSTVRKATSIWQAGAYLHWYDKYGCNSEAVRTATEQVTHIVDCYRSVHKHKYWQEEGM